MQLDLQKIEVRHTLPLEGLAGREGHALVGSTCWLSIQFKED